MSSGKFFHNLLARLTLLQTAVHDIPEPGVVEMMEEVIIYEFVHSF